MENFACTAMFADHANGKVSVGVSWTKKLIPLSKYLKFFFPFKRVKRNSRIQCAVVESEIPDCGFQR